jgi:hypothetical protein
VTPNVVGLLPGHAYKISDLFTALLMISANDAAVALTQPPSAAPTPRLTQGRDHVSMGARNDA